MTSLWYSDLLYDIRNIFQVTVSQISLIKTWTSKTASDKTWLLKVTSQFSLKRQLLNIVAAKLHLSSTTFIEPTNLQLINIALSILHLLNEILCLNEILVKLKLSNFLFSKIIFFCLTWIYKITYVFLHPQFFPTYVFSSFYNKWKNTFQTQQLIKINLFYQLF